MITMFNITQGKKMKKLSLLLAGITCIFLTHAEASCPDISVETYNDTIRLLPIGHPFTLDDGTSYILTHKSGLKSRFIVSLKDRVEKYESSGGCDYYIFHPHESRKSHRLVQFTLEKP